MVWRLALASAGVLGVTSCVTPAPSSSIRVAVHRVDTASTSVGEIVLIDGRDGVHLLLHLHGLPPGDHGMHLHANASCDVGPNPSGAMIPAGAAGGHFDPQVSGHHGGPMGNGHLGDLPVVHVEADGSANRTLIAPRLRSVESLRGHTLIIHANGDNYSDTPAPLGGGGGRMACGVVN
ncbi:MAG: superoxide dismutase family protein [Proteobacteria bacterium]|nr:superoxide dismutase family protein [Pseudomonadota bacterium]